MDSFIKMMVIKPLLLLHPCVFLEILMLTKKNTCPDKGYYQYL